MECVWERDEFRAMVLCIVNSDDWLKVNHPDYFSANKTFIEKQYCITKTHIPFKNSAHIAPYDDAIYIPVINNENMNVVMQNFAVSASILLSNASELSLYIGHESMEVCEFKNDSHVKKLNASAGSISYALALAVLFDYIKKNNISEEVVSRIKILYFCDDASDYAGWTLDAINLMYLLAGFDMPHVIKWECRPSKQSIPKPSEKYTSTICGDTLAALLDTPTYRQYIYDNLIGPLSTY